MYCPKCGKGIYRTTQNSAQAAVLRFSRPRQQTTKQSRTAQKAQPLIRMKEFGNPYSL